MPHKIGKRQLQLIDEMVEHFKAHQEPFVLALKSIQDYIETSQTLKELTHSVKFRIKDPEHLKDKLIRKLNLNIEAGKIFDINKDNLFSKINDLAGFRIIHLHTHQFGTINTELNRILSEQKWIVVKKPTARTWDDESREYFRKIGIGIDKSPNLYTSVHYIIKPNSRANITCEIQVRTLMEEVWGEVDHTINYPHKSQSIACREQIKALARVTSSCSRLVDSIFTSYRDFESNNKTEKAKSLNSKKNKGVLAAKNKKRK